MKPFYIVICALSFVIACGTMSYADPPPPKAPEGFYCSNGLTAPQGGFTAISITAGANSDDFRGCALNADGQIVCWHLVACSP